MCIPHAFHLNIYLASFHFQLFLLDAAVGMGVLYLFEAPTFCFLGIYLGMELLDHTVVLFLIFFKNCHAIFHCEIISIYIHWQCWI